MVEAYLIAKSNNKLSEALGVSCRLKDIKTARRMLLAGANANYRYANGSTLIHEAVYLNHTPLVKLLVNYADLTMKAHGVTPLIAAIDSMASLDIVKTLLAHTGHVDIHINFDYLTLEESRYYREIQQLLQK